MERRNKKRAAIVAAVAGGALAMSGVYATVLSVTARQDAGGAKDVTSCDTHGGVTVTTGPPEYFAGEWYATTVNVTNIDNACQNGNFALYLAADNTDNTGLFTWSATLPQIAEVPVTTISAAGTTVTGWASDGDAGYAQATGPDGNDGSVTVTLTEHEVLFHDIDTYAVAIHQNAGAGL